MRLRGFPTVFLLLLIVVVGLIAASVRPDLPAADAVARFAGPRSQFVAVGGMKVRYRDEGRGPVLLLLHGSNSSLDTWEGWIDRLSDAFRVIALDLPGHGLTGPNPNNRYGPDDQADFLEQFAARLRLDRFSLAGNSMGGQIAWHYALAHPDRVERLILIDAAGFPHPTPMVFRLYSLPVIGRLVTKVTPRFVVANSLRQVYADDSKVTDALVYRYYGMLLREGNRNATRVRFANRRPDDAVERLREIRAPTLIEWGERDVWIPVEHAHRFAEAIPGARLRIYPHLGHIPMEEDPEATAADARAFLIH
ncbi:MAG: alpha/beta hydrolase [Deltaproteobacteria bacterium]|nr:MAG: alpha/beta hydrolase [Deltaproteobacteria bacterium]